VAATELLVIFGEMSARHVFVAVADDGRKRPGPNVEWICCGRTLTCGFVRSEAVV
jgi:hypothetical protein